MQPKLGELPDNLLRAMLCHIHLWDPSTHALLSLKQLLAALRREPPDPSLFPVPGAGGGAGGGSMGGSRAASVAGTGVWVGGGAGGGCLGGSRGVSVAGTGVCLRGAKSRSKEGYLTEGFRLAAMRIFYAAHFLPHLLPHFPSYTATPPVPHLPHLLPHLPPVQRAACRVAR